MLVQQAGEAAADAGDVRVVEVPAAQDEQQREQVLAGDRVARLRVVLEMPRQPARGAATATYVGFMAELENVRNALRAWAMTQGYEVTGRPYEVYKNGIDKAFTADANQQPQGQFDVYWDLKVPGAPEPAAAKPAAAAEPAKAPDAEAAK